ncbi:MAG: hypothetical protein WBB18_09240 [Nodosilinea sp.]
MSRWERWLLPGILATIGVPFLSAGVVVRGMVPQTIADHAQEVARLRISTAATLKERGARVLLEGWVGDRTAPSDQPPLIAYNEYHRVRSDGEWEWKNVRSYAPTLWVEISGGEVEIAEGYTLQSASSTIEDGRDRRYEGFRVQDPVLVLGSLTVAGEQPLVSEAQIRFETKAADLRSLNQDQSVARGLGLLFLTLGSLLTTSAGVTGYLVWQGHITLLSRP